MATKPWYISDEQWGRMEKIRHADYQGTPEYQAVQNYYKKYLGREGGPSEINPWVGDLKVGDTKSLSDIESMISKSPEAVNYSFSDKNPASENYVNPNPAPTFNYDMSGINYLESLINTKLLKSPEFNTDLVKQWDAKLAETQQRGTNEATNALNNSFNALSPYSKGSGGELKATSDLWANILANRQTQALAIGQQDYQDQRNDYQNAHNTKMAIQEFKANIGKYKTDLDAKNYWEELKHKWQLQDENATRLADQEAAKALKESTDSSFWANILGSALTVGGEAAFGPIGGAIGAGVANWITPKVNPYQDTTNKITTSRASNSGSPFDVQGRIQDPYGLNNETNGFNEYLKQKYGY